MCELFGLSSNRPVPPGELLCRFGARGGETADNPDGWGLTTLEDGVFRLTKEPIAAARSARFRYLCTRVRSTLILGHVRKANPPTARVLANTHPFRRACCGREWVFAHNGLLPDTAGLDPANTPRRCAPSGETDSEHAFCLVLNSIAAAFSASAAAEDRGWLETVARAAEMLASHGRFNFLMSDGMHLIAYGHDRLHHFADARAAFRLDATAEVAVIATEPLTEGPGWLAFEPGELRVYRAGRPIVQFITHPGAKPVVSDIGQSTLFSKGVSP